MQAAANCARLRGAGIGMVFQDPATYLNPVFTIGSQLADVLRAHGFTRRRTSRTAASNCWKRCNCATPARC